MGSGLTWKKRIGESSKNSAILVLIFWVVYNVCFVCMLLKVVSHYDSSVSSMSLMGF